MNGRDEEEHFTEEIFLDFEQNYFSCDEEEELMHTNDTLPSTSQIDVSRVPQELSSYRYRIDASVEDQRKYREVLAGLNDQVERYRQKRVESTAQLARLSPVTPILSDAMHGSASTINVLRPSSSAELYRIGPDGVSSAPLMSSTALDSTILKADDRTDPTVEFFVEQLRGEQIRNDTLEDMNDMLREQAEAANRANQCLKEDLGRAVDEVKRLAMEREVERSVVRENDAKTRELLDTQHRHMIELWAAFNRLRRQVSDLRTDTENDLEKQKTEFVRCANNMERTLINASVKQQKEERSKDDEAMSELLKKYEDLAVRNIKTEYDHNEKARKLAQMESTVKKANEERDTARDAIKKILQMPELTEAQGRRARSASPSGLVSSLDVIHAVRGALRLRADEVRAAKRKHDDAEGKAADVQRKLTKAEEMRKKSEQEVADARKEVDNIRQEKEEVERKLRRLNERLERLDGEKAETHSAILRLQEQISSLNLSHQATLDDMVAKQHEDAEKRRSQFDEEMEERGKDHLDRMNRLRAELEKCRKDLESCRAQLETATVDWETERRKCDEKESSLREAQMRERGFVEEIERLKESLEARDATVKELENTVEGKDEDAKKAAAVLMEVQGEKTTLLNENNSLNEEINRLKTELVENASVIEQLEHAEQESAAKIRAQVEQMEELGKANAEAKTEITDIELKLEAANDELRVLQSERAGTREELEKCFDEIAAVNAEKSNVVSERDRLKEELLNARGSVVELQKQIGLLEKNTQEYVAQELADKETIEKLKANEARLASELTNARYEVGQIKESLSERETNDKGDREKMLEAMRKLEEDLNMEMSRLNAERDTLLENARKEKEDLESSLAESEGRLQKLEEEHEKVKEECNDLRTKLEETRTAAEADVAKMKEQMESIELQRAADAAEWEETRLKMEADYSELDQLMQNGLKEAMEIKMDSDQREEELHRKIADGKEALEEERRKQKALETELEEKEDAAKATAEAVEREKAEWNAQLRAADAEMVKVKADASSAASKCADLELALAAVQERLAKKTESLKEAEEELKMMEERLKEREGAETGVKNRLASVERELSELKMQRDQLKAAVRESERDNSELKDSSTSLKKEIAAVKARLSDEENTRFKLISDLERTKTEKKDLEVQLADRASESAVLSTAIKQFEQSQKTMMKDLESERDKSMRADASLVTLRAENERISRDLAHAREALDKKTSSNQSALNGVIENYRAAEKGRVDAIREKETVNGEVTVLNGRLKLLEERREDLERRLTDSEAERAELAQKLAHFESSARRVMTFAKAQKITRPPMSQSDAAALVGLDTAPTSNLPMMRNSASSHDLSSPRVHFEDSRPGSTAPLDISSSVDITFHFLRDRIEQLEKDKAEHVSAVNRMRSESDRQSEASKDAQKKIEMLQKKVAELEEAKRGLEGRLVSSRQLLISQEETIRSREHERKQLKTKVLSADLHVRDKDAKVAFLNDSIASLKAEIASFDDEKRAWRESSAVWEDERLKNDALIKRLEEELQRNRAEINALTASKEAVQQRLNESENATALAHKRCAELESAVRDYRTSIDRMQTDENQWRNKLDTLERKKDDSKEKQRHIETLQRELDECGQKYRSADAERETLRKELREAKASHVHYSHEMFKLQQTIEDLTMEKLRIQDRLGVLDKFEKDSRSLEKEMSRELEQLRAEKVLLTAEVSELKRRLQKADTEKREVDAQRARLERERLALKRHIESLELEKQRTDGAVRQMTAERQALDKSLTAMEKENMELYRNCSQLQNQISQLERENGTRMVEESAAQIRSLEAKLRQVLQEKLQLKKELEALDVESTKRMKLFESKIAVLKEQLEAERRRRREFVDRANANERDVAELRSGLDGSLASLQRLAVQTPTKGRRVGGLDSTMPRASPKSPFRI